MATADLTKYLLANGIKELMQTTPLAKISIKDISDFCNISRNTFYYHFKDKFDLVNWIFYTEITPKISEISDLENWHHGLISLCLYMKENKKFYINALNTEGQNSFSDCLMDFYQTLITNILTTYSQDINLSDMDIHIISRFYSHSLIGIILDWAKDGMNTDPTYAIDIINNLINGNIFKKALALDNFNKKN